MNKYGTFVPKAFDLNELNNRVVAAQAQHDRHKVLYAPASQALSEYDALVKEGYVRSTDHPVLTHSLDVLQAWLQITLVKPKRVVQKEMEQIAIETEELYRAEIKVNQQEALKRMQQRLLIEAQEKQQKEESERLTQLEAEALAEAAQILGLNGEGV